MKQSYVFEKKQLCIGCGVCAGLCNKIKMGNTAIGHYKPIVDKKQCVRCGRCTESCPMLTDEKEKNEIANILYNSSCKYAPETGYFTACYEGKSLPHLQTSASGGMCTRFLEEILRCGQVDGVYCAGHGDSPDKLYSYTFETDADNLKRHSLSAYYPLSLNECIKDVIKNDRTVAIVALPCQVTALRLAMAKNKILSMRIKYIVGLICGGLPGKAMVEYISACKNMDKNEIKKITFREKSPDKKCNNYAIHIYGDDKCEKSYFHNNDDFGFVYLKKFFHNPACNVCRDIYAENADIVFGDAWFNEYKQNVLGTSICLVRNSQLNDIVKGLSNVELKEISIDRMILAQSNVGLIDAKKENSKVYYTIYKLLGYNMGEMLNTKVDKLAKRVILSMKRVFTQFYVQKLWLKYQSKRISYNKFSHKVKLLNKFFRRLGLK